MAGVVDGAVVGTIRSLFERPRPANDLAVSLKVANPTVLRVLRSLAKRPQASQAEVALSPGVGLGTASRLVVALVARGP